MALPTPGASKNSWGEQLNDFLRVGHNEDGTLKGVATEADLVYVEANMNQVASDLADLERLVIGNGSVLFVDLITADFNGGDGITAIATGDLITDELRAEGEEGDGR